MESRPTIPASRRRVLSAALAAVALAAGGGAWYLLATQEDRQALRLLQSDDPDERRDGAWLAASERVQPALAWMAAHLPDEPEFDMRERYIYALGRSRRPAYFDLVAKTACEDPSPYVRGAAWLAAARLDQDRFQLAAHDAPRSPEAWDQIGLAAAWLEAGDVRGLDDLCRWAVEGTPAQRDRASLALVRGIAPLLEAAGRWPLEVELVEGEPWDAGLVAEIRSRCDTIDLPRLAAEARGRLAGDLSLRRETGRVLRARERLARILSRL